MLVKVLNNSHNSGGRDLIVLSTDFLLIYFQNAIILAGSCNCQMDRMIP